MVGAIAVGDIVDVVEQGGDIAAFTQEGRDIGDADQPAAICLLYTSDAADE